MPKTKEIEPLNVSFDQGVRAVVQTKMPRQPEETDDSVVAGQESRIAAFEKENPDFVKELDLLGFEIDEYETVLANSDPQVILSTNTTLPHDVE